MPASLSCLMLAMAIGAGMVVLTFRGRRIPLLLAVPHGILALTGLALLLVKVVGLTQLGMLAGAAGLLAAAALVGAVVLARTLRSGEIPLELLLLHALLALLGLMLVLMTVGLGVN